MSENKMSENKMSEQILTDPQKARLRRAILRLTSAPLDPVMGNISTAEAIDAAREAVMNPPAAALVEVALTGDAAARYHFLHTIYSQGVLAEGHTMTDEDIAHYLLCRGMEVEVKRLGVAVASLGDE